MGLFEKFYSASKEVIDELKKPFAKNTITRKLSAAWDDAESKKIDLEKNIVDSYSGGFDKYDINNIIKMKFDIEKLTKQQEIIKAHYKELFDEDMKTL